jgi:purine-binding chemotaxis protein CheW
VSDQIARVPEITRVPHAREGVINLRGRMLPVVELASRLGLGPTERARSARLVVVDGWR